MKGESSLNPHLIVASLSTPIAYIHCFKVVLMFYNIGINYIKFKPNRMKNLEAFQLNEHVERDNNGSFSQLFAWKVTDTHVLPPLKKGLNPIHSNDYERQYVFVGSEYELRQWVKDNRNEHCVFTIMK